MQRWFRENKSRLLAYSSLTALGAMVCGAPAVVLSSPLAALAPVFVGTSIFAFKFYSPLAGRIETIVAKDRLSGGVFLRSSNPLYQRVAEIAKKMDMPPPRVGMIPSDIYNVGVVSSLLMNQWRNKKSLVFLPAHLYQSTLVGRPAYFTQAEQDAVLIHELAHIKARDTHLTAVKAFGKIFMESTTILGGIGWMIGAVSPAAASMLVLGYIASDFLGKYAERRIEDACDEAAVKYSGDPDALVTALRKLEGLVNHLNVFAENAQDIRQMSIGGVDMVTYRAKNGAVLSIPPRREDQWDSGLTDLLRTHPAQECREENIYDYAKSAGIKAQPLPYAPEQENFPRTCEGYILPPFAFGLSAVVRQATGEVSVITALPAFNRAARYLESSRKKDAMMKTAAGIDPPLLPPPPL